MWLKRLKENFLKIVHNPYSICTLFVFVFSLYTYVMYYSYILPYNELKEYNRYLVENSLHSEEEYDSTYKKDLAEWLFKGAKVGVSKSDVSSYIDMAFEYKHPLIILAVIKNESRFDKNAVCKTREGTYEGLGQTLLNDSSGKSVWFNKLASAGIIKKRNDIFDAAKAIKSIEFTLTTYHSKYGSWRKTLVAYSGGSSEYANRVLSNYAELSLIENSHKRETMQVVSLEGFQHLRLL